MSKSGRKLPLKRINACNTSLGGHLNDVVFHTYCRSDFTIKKKYHEKEIFFYVFYLHLLLKPQNE